MVKTKELEERRSEVEKITFFNILCYGIEMFTLAVCFSMGTNADSIFEMANLDSPVSINSNFVYIAWIVIFLLKGTFSMLPLIYTNNNLHREHLIVIREADDE